jgi:hypothetical protein
MIILAASTSVLRLEWKEAISVQLIPLKANNNICSAYFETSSNKRVSALPL